MSKIKSALELALEKTADLKIDRESLRKNECIKNAKSTLGRILSGDKEQDSWEAFLKDLDAQQKEWASKAAGETLLANFALPRINDDLQRFSILQSLMIMMHPHMENQLKPLFEQASGLFQQYLDSKEQVRQDLMQQVDQQLRRKEQMLEQQTGRPVQLSPQDDPEIMKLVTEQLQNFDNQYKGVLEQMKEELSKLF